jgi:hypothetical protein
MVIDLDEPRENARPVWMAVMVGLLALAVGGVGGYTLGLAAAPSTHSAEATRTVNTPATAPATTRPLDPTRSEADARIASCDRAEDFDRQLAYCMGVGPWDPMSSP